MPPTQRGGFWKDSPLKTQLLLLGTSQSVASAQVRERLHLDLDDIYEGLLALRTERGLVEEAVALSTCGRLELYCVTNQPQSLERLLLGMVSARTGMRREELEANSYSMMGESAARHLFRVASGLDSVVYGEAQILGQVRDAMRHPATEELAGSFTMRLFQSAVAAGKRVRSETEIGRGSASVAGAALSLLEEEMGSFAGKTALVLGAGETGSLVARLLRKSGVGRLLVANRTLSRAEALAEAVDGEPLPLEEAPRHVGGADIVVGAVCGRLDLVDAGALVDTPDKEGRPRYLLDLAHPRNFAPELGRLGNVTLVDLPLVFERVEAARAARAAQVPRAEAIVDAEVENFVQWVHTRESAPILRAVREQVLAIAREEAERRSRGRTEEEREELARFARSLARTLLHSPTVAIREADPTCPEGEWLLRSAACLFGVDEDSRSLEPV